METQETEIAVQSKATETKLEVSQLKGVLQGRANQNKPGTSMKINGTE